jgi:hypothetical protein
VTVVSALFAVTDDRAVGPGFLGFAVLFLMAVAVYLLMRDMTRRVRRLRYGTDPTRRADDVPSRSPDLDQGTRRSDPPDGAGPAA